MSGKVVTMVTTDHICSKQAKTESYHGNGRSKTRNIGMTTTCLWQEGYYGNTFMKADFNLTYIFHLFFIENNCLFS